MEVSIHDIWTALKNTSSLEELDFLKKCFRAYSSEAHIYNVTHDLGMVRKISPPPQTILDFGCGIGLQSYLLANIGYTVYGLETTDDKSLDGFLKGKAERHKITREESMKNVWKIIEHKTNVRFQFYDGKKIPFPDGHFDSVFTYAVLEHIPPDEIPNIVTEIQRVLKANGIFYIYQLPQRTSYTEFVARIIGLESHEFLWDYGRVEKLLKNKGLSIFFRDKVDLFINHPYRIVNPLFPIFRHLNKVLSSTPLSYFAHHLTVIARKNQVHIDP